MPYYRLCFAKDGRAGCFDEFPAIDDLAAVREAELHVERGHGDLWCGERRVATIHAGAARRPASVTAIAERLSLRPPAAA